MNHKISEQIKEACIYSISHFQCILSVPEIIVGMQGKKGGVADVPPIFARALNKTIRGKKLQRLK